jgi:hypothetical protein
MRLSFVVTVSNRRFSTAVMLGCGRNLVAWIWKLELEAGED